MSHERKTSKFYFSIPNLPEQRPTEQLSVLQKNYEIALYTLPAVSCSHEMRCEKLDDTLRRLGLNTEIENALLLFFRSSHDCQSLPRDVDRP